MEAILKKHAFKIVIIAALLVLAVFLISTLFKDKGTPFTMEEETPDFVLFNPQGEEVRFRDSDGQVRLLYFFFSHCPDVCQPTNYTMSLVQEKLSNKKQLGEKASLYSVTFDPARDTQERLAEYSKRLNADPNGWLFLTGEHSREVAADYKIGVLETEGGNFAHTNVIFLIDKEGLIRKFYNATDMDRDPGDFADEIYADIQRLL